MVRPRGRSQLGVDIRGDTSAPAMSTMNEVSPIEPTSPDLSKVRIYLGDPPASYRTWGRCAAGTGES
jgi:hypothetical protein